MILFGDATEGDDEDKDDDVDDGGVGVGNEDGWSGPSEAALADSESGDVTTTVWNGNGDVDGGSSLLQHKIDFMIE